MATTTPTYSSSSSSMAKTNNHDDDNHNHDDDDGNPATNSSSMIWYFSFGANVNPISRRKRNLSTRQAYAARLPGYELTFAIGGSFGSIVKKGPPPSSAAADNNDNNNNNTATCCCAVHGVVMELTSTKDWDALCKIEVGYDVIEEYVYPYSSRSQDDDDDTVPRDPILAKVFIQGVHNNNSSSKDDANKSKEGGSSSKDSSNSPSSLSLPEERYLNIIRQGLQHHGVCSDFIKTYITNQKCTPSPTPDQYRSFPRKMRRQPDVDGHGTDGSAAATTTVEQSDAEDLPTIPFAAYVERSKSVPCMLIDRKVIDLGPAFDPSTIAICQFLQTNRVGKCDATFEMMQILYNPELPPCDARTDVQGIHYRWSEHMLVEVLDRHGCLSGSCHSMMLLAEDDTTCNKS